MSHLEGPDSKPRVIVAHPNTQHSHFLAVGVQQAGMLEAYITQLYYDANRWPFAVLKYLPRSLRNRAESNLYSRYRKELDASRVTTINMYSELLQIAARRAGLPRNLHNKMLLSMEKRFSRRVGQIASHRADILINTDDASRDAFQYAQKHGVICVLDMAIAHRATSQRLFCEEAQLSPEFASSMGYMNSDDDDLQYAIQEALLADYFLVGSGFPKRSLLDLGIDADRIFVIPYGVDTDLFRPQEVEPNGTDQMRVLFAGSADQRKGIGYLLEAVHQLKPTYNIQLTLCGWVDPAIAKNERYMNDFTVLGLVTHPNMPAVYASADVLVLPSLVEGFGRVLLEAMAAGVPIIGSVNTGAPEAVTGDGVEGFVIPIRDTQAIKDRLVFLHDHPKKRREMGHAARKRAVEYFTWERYYRDIAHAMDVIWKQHRAQTK